MRIRWSRWAMGMLVVAAVMLTASRSWAVYYDLGPSKDEWGLKYEVELTAHNDDTLDVEFALADQGRLKPIYSITVVAFSQQADRNGGRSIDLNVPIKLDGARRGRVQIRKEFADRASIRILTLMFDGRRRPTNGAVYYSIPLKKFLKQVPAAGSPQP